MNRPHDHEQMPAELTERLRDATDRKVFLPEEVDQRVLAEAARHLRAHARPAKRGAGWWLPRVAAAACLMVGVGIVSREMGLPSRIMNASEPRAALATIDGDVDGDGVVDIVDAYLLAKRAGESVGLPDINGDGAVDRADADLLAMRIVDLSKGAG